MRLLLDTQLWVWVAVAPARLPPGARAIWEDDAVDLFWSAASLWEVAIKRGLGRPEFDLDPTALLGFLRSGPFGELPVSADHVLPVAALPPLHKDPFDRLLLAQAMAAGLQLVTADRQLARHPGPVRLV